MGFTWDRCDPAKAQLRDYTGRCSYDIEEGIVTTMERPGQDHGKTKEAHASSLMRFTRTQTWTRKCLMFVVEGLDAFESICCRHIVVLVVP